MSSLEADQSTSQPPDHGRPREKTGAGVKNRYIPSSSSPRARALAAAVAAAAAARRPMYKCAECNQRFATLIRLEMHMTTHVTGRTDLLYLKPVGFTLYATVVVWNS